MHITTKRKMWKVALILVGEAEISPKAVEVKDAVQSDRSGGRVFLEWAIDFLACAGKHKAALARYYLDEDAFCIPARLYMPARKFWKEIRKKKLHKSGEKVIFSLY